MMNHGSVALILQAHQPYLRAASRTYHGEEPLHELIATTIIPTLNVLYDLHEQRSSVRVGIAYSPMLLDQLGDPIILKHFIFWLDAWLEQLARSAHHNHNSEAEAYQARFALEWASGIRQSFDQRFSRNLLGALRLLCDEGVIEPLASTATNVCMSNIGQSTNLRAQIELGTLTVTRAFGKQPVGFWPPALDYRAEATTMLMNSGMRYVVVALPEPSWLVPNQLLALPASLLFERYLSVSALSYRGDPCYLAPRPTFTNLAWQRRGVANESTPYDPYDAYRRAQEHAQHFANVLAVSAQLLPHPGLQIIALDAAVIGAEWFEGPTWLRALLAVLADQEQLGVTTPAAYLSSQRPLPTRTLPRLISASERVLIPQALQASESRFALLARRHSAATGDRERMLCQAARELLLAQSANSMREVPHRTLRYLARYEQLCDLADQAAFSDNDLTLLETLEEEDNPFAELNFRMFAR